MAVATSVCVHTDESWILHGCCSAMKPRLSWLTHVELTNFDVAVEVDEAFHTAMDEAWGQELSDTHVSQGAYVSRSNIRKNRPRLSLLGQHLHDTVVWPPRFTNVVKGQANNAHALKNGRSVVDHPLCSSAPSNFLFAPLLGVSARYFFV